MDAQKTQYLIAHFVAETTAPVASGSRLTGAQHRLGAAGAVLVLLGAVAAAVLLLQAALMLS